MSFGLPVAAVIAGALVLAGLLYLLQRLRARRRTVFLPAAALWAQAARDAPLQVLGSRFRYWLAYLLALAIVLLLWLAFAHPQERAGGVDGMRIFYLDLSAGLSADGEAARAERALLADVRATPAGRRTVYLGDDEATLLLAPGESASLLAARLDGLAVAARPSIFADWIARDAGRPAGATRETVRYYGDWPSAREAAARRPASTTLAYGYLAGAVPGNRGIVALGASPAASGRWNEADVVVAIAGPGAARLSPEALRWTLDAAPFTPSRIERDATGALVLRGVPALGGLLRVRLRDGDGFPADDGAALRLPDRRPIRVAIGRGVPPIVQAVIRADDALVLAEPGDAQVIVRMAGDATAARLPALVLTTPQAQAPAFLFGGPGGTAGGDVAARLARLGLGRMAAAALADDLARPISAAIRPANIRSISVWTAVFADGSGFVRTAAMPLFVSRGLRWLAGTDAWIPYAKAGGMLPDQSRLYDLADRATPGALAPGDDVPLAAAGVAQVGRQAIAVSLTDRRTTMAAAGPRPDPAGLATVRHGPPDLPFLLLLLAAGALLAGEWWLFQRGRMP